MCAVVNGPLFSIEARGNIKKTITYSKNFGGNIVKSTPKSRKPVSAFQSIIRTVFEAGKNLWNALTQGEKNVYNDLAEGKQMTGYNLYMQIYLTENIPEPFNTVYGTGLYGQDLY